ncbi:hypothetical protein GF323_00730 [Candidatus Woesearchaeota archaeon]|nr:hypothetical protein [Candidatus Woesearchaeota archaeon]
MAKLNIDAGEIEKEEKKKKIIPEKKEKQEKSYKFNTFSGVVVPSVLAIFGAVMYLILPKAVGGVGLMPMLLIIVIAHSVSIATSFSLSAIATNIKVRGGGLYYLISRSLGSAFGGGLGVQLFLAQTVATSFYSIAFARGFNAVLSYFNAALPEVYLAFLACFIFGVIAWFGAKFVIKLQYFILAAIVLSLISIFVGTAPSAGAIDMFTGNMPFWVAFALFFPAVTGIDAGVGMSGELKDPKKSLVRGTFIAIGFTFGMYLILAYKIGYAASSAALFTDPLIIQKIAQVPSLVLLGILLATSSSALSYFMAGPRTLRALALDNIFSSKTRFLGKNIGESHEPRVALLVCLSISLIVVLSGDLDFVSQIVTIFFLNVYGWLNGAAFFEKVSKNPSYRPAFNAPGIISFYGMAICYAIMYLFNPWVMIISILFQIIVFFILYKTKASIKLESVWDGVLFQMLRSVVNKIEKTEKSKKNWRPNVVAFCANDTNRNTLFSILDWIGAHSGMAKFYYLIQGKVSRGVNKRTHIEADMKEHVKENEQDIFPRVIESDNFRMSAETMLQSETIGNLPPNTALIDYDQRFNLGKLAQLVIKLNKNLIILKNNSGFSNFKFIDVWWDDPKNGNLMLLLAYLISHSRTWMDKEATIRLFKVVRNKNDYDTQYSKLNKLINDSRIDNITFKVIVDRKMSIPSIIRKNSHYADLVLLGLPHAKGESIPANISKEIERYTKGLTTSLVVMANDKIDFKIN